MKVHITLVGGQTAPVSNGILATGPDMVVYICSGETQNNVTLIANEFKNIPHKEILTDATELPKISNTFQRLAKTYIDDEVSINISSGTKAWSYFIIKEFSNHPKASFFYVDQNNNFWDLKDKTKEKLFFDMDRQFRLYGNDLTNYKKFTDYTEKDKNQVSKIRNLIDFDKAAFFNLANKFSEDPRYEVSYVDAKGQTSIMFWNEERNEFSITLINHKTGKPKPETLRSPNIKSLIQNTGWFEYEVACMLSKWGNAQEIRMNCVFKAEKEQKDKNEVDIIINTGIKLLFVECKTKINNPTDIDKFGSVVRNYGGLNSKAIFITDQPLEDIDREKLRDNDIPYFSFKENNNSIGNSIGTDQALFMRLDSALEESNPK